ncbi:MAG: L,D-transpeptidase [Anaerolineae bacterium]|nr:L,D-transpeptidase [Anaerolineae bacterium]
MHKCGKTTQHLKLSGIFLVLSVALWSAAPIASQPLRVFQHNRKSTAGKYICIDDWDGQDLLCPSDRQSSHRWAGYAPRPTATPTPTPVSAPPTVSPAERITTPPTSKGKALVVDQTEQVLRVYEDGVEIRTLPVSTGVRMSYTPPFEGYVGHYVRTMYGFGSLVDHAWYLTKATGNIYIHGTPYTKVEGAKVYEGLEFLGVKPSSHGCIRLHPDDAEWLFTWGPEGVPIRVTPPDFIKFKD